MTAYYNEIDSFAAAWLRNLIAENLIAPGDVDERSIADVRPDDLKGYTQCHFFAGIGGWSYAARLAGWPDDFPVWTGSCPCQPFSVAGKWQGEKDPRHLWPDFRRLISQCNPPIVFGEQVASKDGRLWLSGVRADLEALGYAVGAADLCAAGVGAPHIRQRLYWVADAGSQRRDGQPVRLCGRGSQQARLEASGGGADGGLADSHGRNASAERQQRSGEQRQQPQDGGAGGGMGDAYQSGLQGRGERPDQRDDQRSPWASGQFIQCSDGKARRAEPSIFPLAHGVPNRMGTLRGAGNAIVPQVAAEFMMAATEALAHGKEA